MGGNKGNDRGWRGTQSLLKVEQTGGKEKQLSLMGTKGQLQRHGEQWPCFPPGISSDSWSGDHSNMIRK